MIAETVCSAVSAAGLGIAAVTAYRRRFHAAVRIAAYSLIPVALVMTGVVGWVAGTAFRPTAWAGFVLLAVAWGLFAATRAVERRRGGTRKERRAAARAAREGSGRQEAAAPEASAPALGPAGSRDGGASGRSAAAPRSEDDFSDIEAILKKHGI
ncbi:hypothetical protein [Streptomyces tropicalis]|uniref:Cellulose synthase n=1 Tax=Streptomyces tropicalis TaxID=3034234 RepID=A0ABT6A520_9ACTN|nr:hypothetical protein [Streptomyces tropicalis]MDF3299745.1 hypothetical protein [Streptomyces tropicalis]